MQEKSKPIFKQATETVKIRRAVDEDADAILRIHYDSVHVTAMQAYDQAILNEWAPSITSKRLESHRVELKKQ